MTETQTHADLPEAAEAAVNPATKPVVFQNYWGAKNIQRWYLPDNQQWIEFKTQNEGDKVLYQQKTNRDISFDKSGNTRMGIDPATDRRTLIEMSVTNWFMMLPKDPENTDPEYLSNAANWEEADYSPQLLRKWLTQGDPKAVQDLELEIRKANPWMQSEMTVDDIDKEIANLNELRKAAVEREAAKFASGTK